jgi:WD40 repeat protein
VSRDYLEQRGATARHPGQRVSGRNPRSDPRTQSQWRRPVLGALLAIIVAFSPNGKTLATGSALGFAYLWDIASRHRIATLNTGLVLTPVSSVAFSPDGATLVTNGAGNNGASLWDTSTGKTIANLAAPFGRYVYSVAFSPRGTILAMGTAGGITYLWSVTSRRILAALTDPGGKTVSSVAFGPQGTTLATGDRNGSAYLWNIANPPFALLPTATMPDPGNKAVNSVAFSPGGHLLAVGSADGSTYLWPTG